MLPHIEQPKLPLGPLTIHAFGALVATGVIVGAEVLRRRATRDDLDPNYVQRLITWVLVGGFAGAHLVDRFVYFPAETLENPWTILMVWQGISSFGGFLGGAIGAVAFLRRVRLPNRTMLWRYLDVVAYGLPFGWLFGRIGCFLALDHPGTPTTFFLGEDNGHGVAIHNLGLYEAIYTVVIIAVMVLVGRRPQPPGTLVGVLAVIYAPIRFMLDFLRVRDVRYGGLTPGQWGALTALGLGLYIIAQARRRAAMAEATA
jgi:phosphatidylglycerol:prolipoprotein diacylglycerol transferase